MKKFLYGLFLILCLGLFTGAEFEGEWGGAGACSESDTFTYANGILPTVGSALWEAIDADGGDVASNEWKENASHADQYVTSGIKSSVCDFADDQYAEIDLHDCAAIDNDYVGVVVRAVDGGNPLTSSDYYFCVYAYWDDASLSYFYIGQVDNDTHTYFTQAATYAGQISDGDVLRLEVTTNGSDADLVCKLNGSTLTNGSQTDSTSAFTGGQPGVTYYRGNISATAGDDFSAGDL